MAMSITVVVLVVTALIIVLVDSYVSDNQLYGNVEEEKPPPEGEGMG